MVVIFKGMLEYCLNDHLNHWLTCYIVCLYDTNFTLTSHTNEAEYQKNNVKPLFSLEFGKRNFVVGCRNVNLFIKNSLDDHVIKEFPPDMFFISTASDLINLKGGDAHFFMHQLQYKRCEKQSALHNYVLDPVFYVMTDIGHIQIDESEFLFAITPFEVALVSLFQSCVLKSWPIVCIKRYGANIDKNEITLELGRKAKGGNRKYVLKSSEATEIVTAIKHQIKLISYLIAKPKEEDLEELNCIKRFSEGSNLAKLFTSDSQNKLHSLPATAASFKYSSSSSSSSSGFTEDEGVQLGERVVHWHSPIKEHFRENLTYESIEIESNQSVAHISGDIIYDIAETGEDKRAHSTNAALQLQGHGVAEYNKIVTNDATIIYGKNDAISDTTIIYDKLDTDTTVMYDKLDADDPRDCEAVYEKIEVLKPSFKDGFAIAMSEGKDREKSCNDVTLYESIEFNEAVEHHYDKLDRSRNLGISERSEGLAYEQEIYPVNDLLQYESLEINKKIVYDDVEITSESKRSFSFKKRAGSKKHGPTFVSYLPRTPRNSFDDNCELDGSGVYDKLNDEQGLIYNKLNDPALVQDDHYHKLQR